MWSWGNSTILCIHKEIADVHADLMRYIDAQECKDMWTPKISIHETVDFPFRTI